MVRGYLIDHFKVKIKNYFLRAKFIFWKFVKSIPVNKKFTINFSGHFEFPMISMN